MIPDARHCHHFEVRYVRPGNKIFYEDNSDGLFHAQYLPFHEEFNIECDEGVILIKDPIIKYNIKMRVPNVDGGAVNFFVCACTLKNQEFAIVIIIPLLFNYTIV